MTESKILGKSLRIVSGAQELIGLPQALPFRLRELNITAADDVIIRRNNVQRRGICRSETVGVIREPGNETGALRDLVGNFAIGSLRLTQEVERGTGCFVVNCRVESQRSPQGIPPIVPRKTKLLTVTGSAMPERKPAVID